MNFLTRLRYYAFGATLGCILVYFMLIKDRDLPAWLPGDRIIEELTMDSIYIADGIVLPFADSLLVGRIEDSDVLFSESEVREKPCREYQLESDTERMRLSICKHKVTLTQYVAR